MKSRRLDSHDERGLATVELGLMLGFLMLLALGAFEYGMLFAKSQDVASASAAIQAGCCHGRSAAPCLRSLVSDPDQLAPIEP